jgi:hypothetical protein
LKLLQCRSSFRRLLLITGKRPNNHLPGIHDAEHSRRHRALRVINLMIHRNKDLSQPTRFWLWKASDNPT